MSLALLDDDRERTAKFLVTFLDNKCLIVEGRVEAAANVQKRHAGLGQRRSSGEVRDCAGTAETVVPDGLLAIEGNLRLRCPRRCWVPKVAAKTVITSKTSGAGKLDFLCLIGVSTARNEVKLPPVRSSGRTKL